MVAALERVQGAIRERRQLAQLSRMSGGMDDGARMQLFGDQTGPSPTFPAVPLGDMVPPGAAGACCLNALRRRGTGLSQVSVAVGQAAITALAAVFRPTSRQNSDAAPPAADPQAGV